MLRMPQVYMLHPDPETAAAIMVSDHFDPQIQALLFNYIEVATGLDVQEAATDSLHNCACRTTVLPLTPDDLNGDGHVCTFDLSRLKWPELQPFNEMGKKYRIPATRQNVQAELEKGADPVHRVGAEGISGCPKASAARPMGTGGEGPGGAQLYATARGREAL